MLIFLSSSKLIVHLKNARHREISHWVMLFPIANWNGVEKVAFPMKHASCGDNCCFFIHFWKQEIVERVFFSFFFLSSCAQGVIECTRENRRKWKVHLCTVRVHPETWRT